jgi:hypothetical protein
MELPLLHFLSQHRVVVWPECYHARIWF